jgi:type I restriction enzyme M protein
VTYVSQPLPDARALFAAAQARGRDGVWEALPDDIDALRTIVGTLGLDPDRRVRKWKEPVRIREFIADEITKRATRNRSFFGEHGPGADAPTAPVESVPRRTSATITGELKSRVDRLWTTFWNNGLSNPLAVIEQLSYLIFMRRLDEQEKAAETAARRLGRPVVSRYFEGKAELRWSELKRQTDPAAQLQLARAAFEHIKALPRLADTPYARHMKDAVFLVPAEVIASAIKQVDDIFDLIAREEADAAAQQPTQAITKDLKGDLYEYMLSKLSQAGTNGQFRTPRHIIDMMVQLVRPKPADTICDPACGTAGFLVGAARYLLEEQGEALRTDPAAWDRFVGPMFSGYDFDGTMLRIGSMNLLLHGIERPDVDRADSLSEARKQVRDRFSLVLANPPFKGSVDMDLVASDLLGRVGLARPKRDPKRAPRAADEGLSEDKKAPGAKTELLFLAQILASLQVGGRAAVIVPDGVLFGSSKAHVAIRKELLERHILEAVISMPSGVFKPYAGVSTAVLYFVRTHHGGTSHVWFYDMKADGYSLDDKRAPVAANDIPDVIKQWRLHSPGDPQDDRTRPCFTVPKAEIAANGYDLSINRYKAVVHEAVEFEAPGVILGRLEALEGEILAGIGRLRGMVG